MNRTQAFRRILWAAVAFNLFGAYLFAYPASTAGQLLGLPPDVPLVYRAIVAVFVLLFGGAYAWLALQPEPNRPLVAFSAIGKTSVFVMIAILWLANESSLRGVLAALGDLFFAAAFAWWLLDQKATSTDSFSPAARR
ncbi:MAG: hypothetical protein ACREXT_06920 [Gammaproteobacteria bacterium]